MRRRTHRRPPQIPLMVAAALLVAACGSSSAGGTGVASLDDTTPSTGGNDEVATPQDSEDALAAYEDCMAEEGIEIDMAEQGIAVDGASDGGGPGLDVHEDDADAEGDPQAGPQDRADLDLDAMEEAEQKCAELLEGVVGALELDPAQQARLDDAIVAFDACMEEQGIDIPDGPGRSGGLVVEREAAGDDTQDLAPDDVELEAFQEAAEQCDHIWDEVEDLFGFGDEEVGR